MITGLYLYRAARLLVDRYGDESLIHAAMRVDEFSTPATLTARLAGNVLGIRATKNAYRRSPRKPCGRRASDVAYLILGPTTSR